MNELTLRISFVFRHIMGLAIGKPVSYMFRSLFLTSKMNIEVLFMSENNQVFYSIIRSIFIDMVNMLFLGKQAVKLLFHNQPMFTNISLFSGVWMLRRVNVNVPIPFDFATAPLRVMFTRSNTTFCRAVFATSIFKYRGGYKKIFAAGNTNSLNWRVSIFSLFNHTINYRR